MKCVKIRFDKKELCEENEINQLLFIIIIFCKDICKN